jgi:hypothetical protein
LVFLLSIRVLLHFLEKVHEELRCHRGSCKNEHRNETVTSIQRENFFVAEVMRRMIKALSEYVVMIGHPQERLDMQSYPLHLWITCEYPCESFFKRDGKTTPCLVVPVF